MGKKIVSGTMLMLSLIGMLTLAFSIKTVGAPEAIYIRADGSVNPSTAPIGREGNLYWFTDDVNGSVVIEKNDIVLDGGGHRLYGVGDIRGVDITNRENVTLTRLVIQNFTYGIWLAQSNYNRLFNNTIIGNDRAIWLTDANYNNITANILLDNKLYETFEGSGRLYYANHNIAIYLWESNYNVIVDNQIMDNHWGIIIWFGIGNTLRRNTMVNNGYNFYISGRGLHHYINDIDSSNTVNGKPLYYWVSRRNETIPPDAGAVVIVNSTNMKVENLTMTSNIAGIKLAFTSNSQIRNVTVANNLFGIELHYSHYNIIAGINASNNANCGILLDRSNFNLVVNNTAMNNTGFWAVNFSGGIYLEDTGGNIIANNAVVNNTLGIGFDDSWDIEVIGNDIVNNYQWGIMMGFVRDSVITQNNLTNNSIGIWILQLVPAVNAIYHNNFMDNSKQVELHENPVVPGLFRWNAEYPSGGNYWSDYDGTDLFSGNFQNETGMDGIGDAAYVIDARNRDNYPLMNPWHPTDISILNVTLSETDVYLGQSINITVNVVNRGRIAETFAVTSKLVTEGVEYTIGTMVVDLGSEAATTLVFNWTTRNIATSVVKVEATILPDETNPTDNNMINPDPVKVKMVGDINGDNKIDIKDISAAALAFGSHLDEPGWNGQADINQDNKVDIRDLALIAKNFGKTHP